MEIQNIVIIAIILGVSIVRFLVNNKKKQIQQQQQAANQEQPVPITSKEKSKMQEFLERLELIEEGELDQRLGMPGTQQGRQPVRQPGVQPQMPPGAQPQRPPGQPQIQPVMQAQMHQQQMQPGMQAQMQQQQMQRATPEELKQKQKRQEKVEQLRRQQQQKTVSKTQANKEVENQEVVRRGSFGIDSQRQLVNGIIMSEILGPPRALKKR